MSLIQKWQGALYFKNLRDYLVDGTALLEIRAMGSSGFLKAMFYWAEPAGEPDFNAELSGPFEMEGRYHKENDIDVYKRQI